MLDYKERKKREIFNTILCTLNLSNKRIEVSLTGLMPQIIIAAPAIIIHHQGMGVRIPIKPKIPKNILSNHLAMRGQLRILRNRGCCSTVSKNFCTFFLNLFLDFLAI